MWDYAIATIFGYFIRLFYPLYNHTVPALQYVVSWYWCVIFFAILQ